MSMGQPHQGDDAARPPRPVPPGMIHTMNVDDGNAPSAFQNVLDEPHGELTSPDCSMGSVIDLEGSLSSSGPVPVGQLDHGSFLAGFDRAPIVPESFGEEIELPAWQGSYDVLPEPERVIDGDSRELVRFPKEYPFNLIARLRIRSRGNRTYIGTAWFGAPNVLFTAGHCVFLRKENSYAESIEVLLGQDSSGRNFTPINVTNFVTTRRWMERGSHADDYAAIKVNFRSEYNMGWKAYSDEKLKRTPCNIFGYPSDKDPKYTMWGMSNSLRSVSTRHLYYTIDTNGGQSGAPVFTIKDGIPIAVGIHNYGGRNSNYATRITPEVHSQMRSWYQGFNS